LHVIRTSSTTCTGMVEPGLFRSGCHTSSLGRRTRTSRLVDTPAAEPSPRSATTARSACSPTGADGRGRVFELALPPRGPSV
jgi:hypothetical protein